MRGDGTVHEIHTQLAETVRNVMFVPHIDVQPMTYISLHYDLHAARSRLRVTDLDQLPHSASAVGLRIVGYKINEMIRIDDRYMIS